MSDEKPTELDELIKAGRYRLGKQKFAYEEMDAVFDATKPGWLFLVPLKSLDAVKELVDLANRI